mmetsp:Transcript_23116/g.52135  ORF Transcript_23116/g.52135 Transcript_23116/m.52135 type:complete len:273 (+) Transcript_23116:739-1557(+)
MRLNETTTALETQFAQNILQSSSGTVQVPSSAVSMLNPSLWQHVPQAAFWGSVTLGTDSRSCHAVLRHSPDPIARKQVYHAMHEAANPNRQVLDALVLHRHETSRRLGFESFSHRTLQDKMVTDPEVVKSFLRSVAEGLRAQAEAEAEELIALKSKHEDGAAASLEQWDVPFYTGLAKDALHRSDLATSAAQYFPLSRCIKGLALLCQKLFAVEVEMGPAPRGESWASRSITRLVLTHPTEGKLGTIYLDLEPREGKCMCAWTGSMVHGLGC